MISNETGIKKRSFNSALNNLPYRFKSIAP